VELRDRYLTIWRSVANDLVGGIKPQCTQLFEQLEAYLHYDIASQNSRINPSVVLHGLAASIYSIVSLRDVLQNSPDIRDGDRAVLPIMLASDYCVETYAQSDVTAIASEHRIVTRFITTLLSPLGTVLKLFPAWLLLTAFSFALSGLDIGLAALLSGGGLAAIGLIESAVYRQRATRLQQSQNRRTESRIAHTVQGLLSRALWDQRGLIISRLNELLFHLSGVNRVLHKNLGEAERVQERMEPLIQNLVRSTGPIYNLTDISLCQEWIQQVNVDLACAQSMLTLFRNETISLFRQTGSYYRVARSIQNHVNVLASQYFDPNSLEPVALADARSDIQGGLRWRWLSERAVPLGNVLNQDGCDFTLIVLGTKTPLVTVDGTKSEHWGINWGVVLSMQPHEIICIRGAVER